MQELAMGEDAERPEPPGPAEDVDGASRAAEAMLAVACVAVASLAGSWVFARSPAPLTFGPLVGIIAALAVRRRVDAALAAALGAALGLGVAAAGSPLLRADTEALGQLVLGAAVATAAAFGGAWLLEQRPDMRRLLAGTALALAVLGMWSAGVYQTTTPAQDGSTFVGMMSEAPPIERLTPDEGLYLRYVERLRAGDAYYPMAASVLQEANAKRIGPVDLLTPLGYRLPTLYVLLSKLPPPGMFLVLAMLGCGTIAVLAAFSLASRLAVPSVALASAAAVAAFYASMSAHPSLLDAEPWAGALVLLALALFAAALARGPRSVAWMWAAASAALAATLVRELAAPVVLLGLAAALTDGELRRRKQWLPWLFALALTGAAYYAHWAAALAVIRTLPPQPPLPDIGFFDPTGVGLAAGLHRMAALTEVARPVAWVLAAAAVVGTLAAPRERPLRLALAGCVIGGCAALLVVHPLGVVAAGEGVPSYWIDLLIGPLLASAPLALALLPGGRPARDTEA